ncbi:MAG: UDP-N-acetylglucosamine--N-acetylmuramyl-(pentapeptide) pyrophosphoryl-undecaprenol N-acetylglucosamine transferase [Treponema sp.]|nr:UDP-N-acetylglucosamine--N-acetylmuramyl-(pentapeptide) pyrophosphoryl-undecaprenol N-acetylglucosamine transferase [Treponema sp.]
MHSAKNVMRIVCTGGGTGGHIYPGIAVADEIRALIAANGTTVELYWIGSASGMDRSLVEKNLVSEGGSITAFYGIPCGKLRRYFSLRNVLDVFKIIAGFFVSLWLLARLKPVCVFSKGGFVSVPPCRAASFLRIPYYTHECDCTPGLATRLNSGKARVVLVSYADTVSCFKQKVRERCKVTGNPVRPVFYEDHSREGRAFLELEPSNKKPVLLVLGGSLGARQINSLVAENFAWLTERFVVVHQTGRSFADEYPEVMNLASADYRPFAFIHAEMPAVVQAADVVLSRAGANSLWECAVCKKPMVLVPLCGSGTRGDQVDNASFFEKRNIAKVLVGSEATSENLKSALAFFLDEAHRAAAAEACQMLCGGERPARSIARLICEEFVI